MGAWLTVNKEKSLYNLTQITFLEWFCHKNGISANEVKIEAIRELKKPENISQHIATYLGSFIPNFAVGIDPLQKLLRKEENW